MLQVVAQSGEPVDGERVVAVNQDLKGMVDGAQEVLRRTGKVFVRSGMLVHVEHVEESGPVALLATLPYLREMAQEGTRWMKVSDGRGKTKDEHEIIPPKDVIETLLARGAWDLPHLHAVVDCPTMRQDGSIIQESGYDAASGIYVAMKERFPKVPDKVTAEQAHEALGKMAVPIAEYPFEEAHHGTAAIAAILTSCCRTAINGPTPMFVVDGTTPGCGKGLMSDVISIVATGTTAGVMKATNDDDEDRKTMLSLALGAVRVVMLDECQTLATAAINSAITAGIIRGRVLGLNKIADVQWSPTWIATGNNIRFIGDTTRRVIPIRITPNSEDPETRQFKIPDLKAWVLEHRGELIRDALTVMRWWFAEGVPDCVPPLGGFEDWSRKVRGAIVALGYADPCDGRKEVKTLAEDGASDLGRVLTTFREQFGSQYKTARQMIEFTGPLLEVLKEVVYCKHGELTAVQVGHYLKRTKGRVACGLRFKYQGDGKDALVWGVEEVRE